MAQNLYSHHVNGNMHAVDALASVREKIAELKKIEADLRDQILSSPQDRVGDIYKADVVLSAQNRICQEKIVELIGDIEKVKRPVEVTIVRVIKIGSRR
jgi:FtsZ-binding cell division protein ZapB